MMITMSPLELHDCSDFGLALRRRPSRGSHAVLALMTALLACFVAWSLWAEADLVVIADGQLRPRLAADIQPDSTPEEWRVTPLHTARVIEVHVRQGDVVAQGDVLLRLDAGAVEEQLALVDRSIRAGEEDMAQLATLYQLVQDETAAALQKARTELVQAETIAQRAERQRETDMELARLELQLATEHEQRLQSLLANRAVSESDAAAAAKKTRELQTRLRAAESPVDRTLISIARSALELTQRDQLRRLAELEREQQKLHSDVEAARLQRTQLTLRREQYTLHALRAGVVTDVRVRVGDVAAAGVPALTLAAQDTFQFEALVSNADIAHLRPGLPSRVKLDALDTRTYGTVSGRVIDIAPDTRSLASDRAGSYVVRIELARHDGEHRLLPPLKLGMSGRAEVITDRSSVWTLLLRRIDKTVSLTSD